MKVGEVWKRKASVVKALLNMGAHPISIGSGKVRIVEINDKLVKTIKLYAGDYVEEVNVSRNKFVNMYEKDYDYKEEL